MINGVDKDLEESLDDIFEEEEGVVIDDPEKEKDLPLENEIFDEPAGNEVLNELLEAKGIKDGKVTILNENDEEEKVDFYSLPKEEQLEILSMQESEDIKEEPETGLTEEEIAFLNQARVSGKSINEYINSLAQPQATEDSYDIDAYSDEELFLLDLKSKYDLTDEELTKKLEKALEDEQLFKKKVTKTREEYKQLEENYKQTQQEEFAKQQEEQYNAFAQTMVNVATTTPEFYGIELEDSEKNEVLSFILDLDESGTSNFYKQLNDPKKMYEAAWFLKYGKDAFEVMQDAYEQEIRKLKKDNKPPVVKKRGTKQPQSIYDLN